MPVAKKLEGAALRAVQRIDGWYNALTGLGDALADKTASTRMIGKRGQGDSYYEDLFHSDALARRIAELPAKEMLRQGFEITLGDTEDSTVDSDILAAYQALKADTHFFRAMTLARALGGAGIVLGVDDGVTDSSQPLNEDGLKRIIWLRVIGKDYLRPRTYYPSGSERFGEVETYDVTYVSGGGSATEILVIHESRVIVFDGTWVTDRRRLQNNGWGDSVYVAVEDALAKVGTSFQALGHMLVDASQGKFKLRNLQDMVADEADGDALIDKRMRIIERGRSIARSVVLDAEGEDFEYSERTFSGIPETVSTLMFYLSAVTGIPVTLLFGRSPAGLNATGDADIRFFYDDRKAEQTTVLKAKHERLISLLMRSKQGPTGGVEPENWDIVYNPLWQLTELEQATLRKTTAEADAIDIDNQVLLPEEVALSRYGGDRYSTNTVIDESLRAQLQAEQAKPADQTGADGNGNDIQPPK